MADAFIYDHVRTPRGRGKADGALHQVPAVDLAVTALGALRDRNGLDPILVEDVVMGCVDPVGEAGGDIARAAALEGRFRQGAARCADQPLLRLGAGRSQSRRRAGDVRHEGSRHRRGRRIDEPDRHGALRAAPGRWTRRSPSTTTSCRRASRRI